MSQIEETATEVRCYWQAAGDDRTCEPCLDASRQWNPYKIAKDEAA